MTEALAPITPALPSLPRDFDTQAAGMSKKEREVEVRRRQAEFVKAKAQLAAWIRQDRNPLMTKTAKLVTAYLIECVNFETGRCFPSHETIADHLGISDRQVRRVIPKIVKSGWLSILRVRRNAPTFYQFHAPDDVVKRIEEAALALRQNREDRRLDRRFPKMIDHEPAPDQLSFLATPDRTSVSARPHSDRTFLATPDRTSVSGEHLRETPEIDSLLEEGESLKVSTTPRVYGALPPVDPNEPLPRPETAEELASALADFVEHGFSPAAIRYLRAELVAGTLTLAKIEEQRSAAA